MVICLCHRVSDRDIAAAVRAGTRCFETLQGQLRVASGCGNCHDCARETFDLACAEQASRSPCGEARAAA